MGNNKILLILYLWVFSHSALSLEHPLFITVDEVKPIEYPKFSVALNYNFERNFHGFADKSLRIGLGYELGAILAFEAGIYKYFNAGAQLSFGIPPNLQVPLHLALGLFVKPYFPLGDRCSIFSRIGAGISASQGGMKAWIKAPEINRIFGKNQYYATAFGGNAHASIGIEYFPWPLFGFAFEGGVQADLLRERGVPKNSANAPRHFDFVIYEFPLTLMAHIIL